IMGNQEFIFRHQIPIQGDRYINYCAKTDSSSFRSATQGSLIWIGFCPNFPAIHRLRAGIGLNVSIGCTASIHDAQETTA
ncbi:hypothetical protein, partial [Aeromonas sp. A35_P]|uniref:hypothetical protein n=1 Tax=Aeromonas sp. A35_P TaxID=1983805 RepID=UPI001C3D91D1